MLKRTTLLFILICTLLGPSIPSGSAETYLIEGNAKSFSDSIDYLEHVDISVIDSSFVEQDPFSRQRFHADSERSILSDFSLPFHKQKWHISAFNFQQAWRYEPVRAVKVAIIDTGISRTLLEDPRVLTGINFINPEQSPIDDNGHGTALASVTLDVIGPYPVQIVPIKAADRIGSFSVSNIVKAIDYAIEQQVDVINLSFGATTPHALEQQAIAKAIDAGIEVFSSSGNTGREEYFYPATYPDVVSVGAINDKLQRASFSVYNDALDFVAPGETMYVLEHSGVNRYSTINGTSFATAYLAAQYAVLRATSFDFSMEQLAALAVDLGLAGYDKEYGHGMLQMDTILEAVRGNNWNTVTTSDPNKAWTIQFSKAVDTSLPLNVFIKVYDNALVEQLVHIEASPKVIVVKPTKPLRYGEYWLVIDSRLTAKNGQQLKQPAVVKFIVQ